jgi:hypothetical protein
VKTSRRSCSALAFALAVIALLPDLTTKAVAETEKPPPAPKTEIVKVPKGWRVARQYPHMGVEVIRMAKKRQRVSIVAIAPSAKVNMVHALAHDQLSRVKPTQRPSQICRRLGCVAGINGAFFDRDSGLPFSGIISQGELLRSVTSPRPHVAIQSGLLLDQTTPPVQVLAYPQGQVLDPIDPSEAEPIVVRGVNRTRGSNGIAIYSRKWGKYSPGSAGKELLLRAMGQPQLLVGSQVLFQVVGIRKPGGTIRSDEIVLSGTGDGARRLSEVWRRIISGELSEVMTVEIGSGPSTLIGTRPVIVRDGQPIRRNGGYFARSRHPRSVLAARSDGTIMFVVIDGRAKKARGMSLKGAAALVRSLGAFNAANLDGGGSSVMVVQGRVQSRPAGGERRVSTALAIVPR